MGKEVRIQLSEVLTTGIWTEWAPEGKFTLGLML